MRTTISARLLAATSVALLMSGTLAACGSAKDDSLSKAKADSALLTVENVGDTFTVKPTTDDKSSAPGCLKDLNAKTHAPVEAKRDFESKINNGFPSVGVQLSSYKTEDAATKAMESARAAISKCTSVTDDSNGTTTELTITNDSKKLADGADEELNITATGKVTAEGTEVPIALSFAAVRVKSDVTIVTLGDLAADSSANLATYLNAAVGRLAAVRAGKTPSSDLIETSHLLSSAEATTALMTAGNLGGGFAADTTADHSTPSSGCLSVVDPIANKSDAPTHVVADYASSGKTGFPLVSNVVASYNSVADAKAALEKFRTGAAACTSVDATDQGNTTKLTVSVDQTKTEDATDDQVNLQAVGTISNSGGSTPLWLGLAVVRIANNLTVVTVGDLADKAPGDVSQLIKVVDDRLIAVMAGQQPADVVAGG